MKQGRGGQRSKKSACSRRGVVASGPAVQLATSLVDDNIGGPAQSATAAASATSSWKPTGDPFGMGSSVGSGNSVQYQQSEYQSPSLFHQQQGSPVPGNNYGNNTPQQQHYSPLTPVGGSGGGGSSTPVPYSGGRSTPNSQHGMGQFNNVSCGNGAQMPFGSPSSVSSSGGFISGPSTNRPGSGATQTSPFGNQQFYVGSGVGSFNQQQHGHGATAGMMNAIDNGPGGRIIVDHPSCFPSSMVGGRRSYGGYGGGVGGPPGNLGGSVHHSVPTGHHGVPPGGSSNLVSHHGALSGPLHCHGSTGGPSHHSHSHVQPDYRIFELNKRLQNRNEDSDNIWWDQFATEFFEDDATLTLTFCLEDGPKRYSIGRTLIPRYFRSIFEGGVTDLYYHLRANSTKESFQNTSLTLDCDHCTMITTHFTSNSGCGVPSSPGSVSCIPSASLNGNISSIPKSLVPQGPSSSSSQQAGPVLGSNLGVPPSPVFTRVCTEGRLTLEFTYDDMMRIRTWNLAVRQHKELVLRSTAAAAVIAILQHGPGSNIEGGSPPNAEILHQQVAKNITRQGITNSTLNYLRLCVILEPMQELMWRHKAYALSPRDCLKTTLFQKWQRMIAPPESQRPANKRRKRKGSNSGSSVPPNTSNSGPGVGPTTATKKRSPGPNGGGGHTNTGFNLVSQDVMVVGEPSLMGGEFGDEDERLITRLENTQYDATSSNSVTTSVMGISGASGSVSSVGGNDNMPHINTGSNNMLNGEPLFPGTGNDCTPGTPTLSGNNNVSQSNSNGHQQQQNSWSSGPSSSGGLSNNNSSSNTNNGQQGSNPVTVGSVSGGSVNPGNNGPPCSSNSVGDSISDKKSPASACIQQH